MLIVRGWVDRPHRPSILARLLKLVYLLRDLLGRSQRMDVTHKSYMLAKLL